MAFMALFSGTSYKMVQIKFLRPERFVPYILLMAVHKRYEYMWFIRDYGYVFNRFEQNEFDQLMSEDCHYYILKGILGIGSSDN